MINYNPTTLKEFIGQRRIKEDLTVLIKHSQLTKEIFNHTIIFGGAGYGKTTLAQIIAHELNYDIKIYFGGSFSSESLLDMFDCIKYSDNKMLIFIDEIHAMKPKMMEYLLLPMESFIYEGKKIPYWTLVAGTTDFGKVIAPLRGRFSNIYKLEDYHKLDIVEILKLYGCNDNILDTIASRCRGIPRIAKQLFERIKKEWEVLSFDSPLTMDVDLCNKVFNRIGLDEYGLYQIDREIIKFLYSFNAYAGSELFNPCGVDNLCIRLDISKSDYLLLYEPYLVKIGFIVRLPKGRIITKDAISKVLKIQLKIIKNDTEDYFNSICVTN